MLGDSFMIFLGSLFLLALLPSLQAKVFWFHYYPVVNHYSVATYPAKSQILNREQEINDPKETINHVFKLIQDRRIRNQETIENKCSRLFGSIYGTKDQRIKCLQTMKKKKKIEKLQEKNQEGLVKDTFIDFTRAVEANMGRTDSNARPNFSTDYIDFGDLRRSNKDPTESMQRQRTFYSSDSNSDSDESVEVKKKSKTFHRKPKRFQIIDNEKRHKYKYSSDDSEDSDVQFAKDLSSEEEFRKPVKKKKKPVKSKSNKKREFYLQGSRLLSVSPDDDGRRRVRNFLPKRYHWKEEEIHDLGYYWFNGPQGRYPFYALRP